MTEKSIWSFFTKTSSIRCINLLSRRDRYNQSLAIFKKYNIPVTYYHTERHPNGGLQGCYESHIACIRESYDKGDTMCFIFEDDVINSGFIKNTKLIKQAITFLQKCKTWDIFYFGTCPDTRTTKIEYVTNSILKMSSLCTHAYVIHRRYMKQILNTQFVGIPIDYIYKYNKNSYAIYPSIFYQSTSASDISGDLWNKIPFKHQFFRLNEIYAKYLNKPLNKVSSILSFGFVLLLILYIVKPKKSTFWLIIVLVFILILIIQT